MELAALPVAAVAHREDEADLPDVEASVAVVEVVVEAVASQEAADAVAVVLADVDEEDTKCFGLGRRPPHPGHAEERDRLRCRFGRAYDYPPIP